MFRGWWMFMVVLLVAVALAFTRAGEKSRPVLKCEPLEEGGTVTQEAVAKAIDILTQRVGESGVVEEGPEKGMIRLSYGEGDISERELQFLIGVGNLEMALVPKQFVPGHGGSKAWMSRWEDQRTGEEVQWSAVYEASEVLFSRDDLSRNSQLHESPRAGEWDVRFEIADARKAEFREKTGANVGRILAFVLDGEPLMVPVIRSAIATAGVVISGHFTEREAMMLSRVLNTEPLPVRLSMIGGPAADEPG